MASVARRGNSTCSIRRAALLPPPLRLPADRLVRAGWLGIVGGPLVILANRWLHLGSFVSLLGGIAFLAGFATLVARMRDERDDDHDITGGAVV